MEIETGIGYPSARTLGFTWPDWAEPEGMLVTFHVFTAALIKGGCVWNHAVAPGARSDVRITTKARPGSRVGYVRLKRPRRSNLESGTTAANVRREHVLGSI